MIVSLCLPHRVREFAPTEDEKWVAEFEEQMKSDGGVDLQSIARNMSQSVTDPDIQDTEVQLHKQVLSPD